MVDWADLPAPALNLISRFLPFAADYIRFRSVCSSWRSSAPKRPNLPILAGHRIDGNGFLTIFNFFSFNGSEIIPIDDEQLPEVSLERFCCGSSHGWMAFLDRTPGITLWNPVTKCHIQLPTLTHFPDIGGCNVSKFGDEYILWYDDDNDDYCELCYVKSFEEMRRYLANKVVLSADPSSDPNCVALLIHCWWRKLSFCRIGDDVWTNVQFRDFGSFHTDAVFYRGKFHIVSRLAIYVLNVGQELMLERIPVANPPFDGGVPSLPEIDECYIVDSSGDLLLVNYYNAYVSGRAYCFEVYKVDWGMHRMKLLKLKSLGDRALFLGRNQSVSLSASKFLGCRANCIYMAECYQWREEIRVYNLEDGISDFIANSGAQSSSGWSSGWLPCAWVMPSLL